MAQQWNFLKTPKDYETAMRRLEAIIDDAKDSPDHNEALLLSLLLHQYSEEYLSLPPVDPIKMIKSRMQDLDYTANDLAKAYGDKEEVNKVLDYKQPLSLTMVRKFSELLRIPVDVLAMEYKTVS